MVSVMNLTGYVVVEKHHHAQHNVFPIIGAHVVGMYALVLVVGTLIDRVGRTPALASGLLVMGASALGAVVDLERPRRPECCSSASGSAGTSPTSPRPRSWPTSRMPSERGRLFGFNDFAAAMFAAALALLGGPDARDARRHRDGLRRRRHRHGPGAVAAVPAPSRPRGGSHRFRPESRYTSAPADASVRLFFAHEDLQRQARRDRARVVRRRRRGQDARPARDRRSRTPCAARTSPSTRRTSTRATSSSSSTRSGSP